MIQVRAAVEADLGEVTHIYNDAILTTTATFDTEVRTPDQGRAWFAEHHGRYPVLVAEDEGRIVGWASLSPMGTRPGWRYTVEDSVYVHRDCRGRGTGRALLEELVRQGRQQGFHVIIARIVTDNAPSIKLHERLGFEVVGCECEVGRKFGRWLDLLIMQLTFDEGQAPSREAGGS